MILAGNHKRYKRHNDNSFWRLSNWKLLLLISTGLFLFFPLFRYLKRQFQLNSVQQDRIVKDNSLNDLVTNPDKILSKADQITTNKTLQSVARKLANDFGVNWSDSGNFLTWFNPRGWTENDKIIGDALLKYKSSYPILKRLYFIYTNSRDLTFDINAFLDNDQKTRISTQINLI